MGWIQKKLETGEYFSCKDIYKKLGFRYVMGAAVNGETAIAGPITVVSIVLAHDHRIKNIKPYTELSPEQFMRVYKRIREKCLHLRFGWASPSVILRAGKQSAMDAAFGNVLGIVTVYNPMSVIIVDGHESSLLFENLKAAGTPVISHRGCASFLDTVIAANLIAKVARETVMFNYCHKYYPEYNWDTNFGYFTKAHIEAIKEYGITPFHRDLSNVKGLQGVRLKANIKEE